jgi:hypothetical protein
MAVGHPRDDLADCTPEPACPSRPWRHCGLRGPSLSYGGWHRRRVARRLGPCRPCGVGPRAVGYAGARFCCTAHEYSNAPAQRLITPYPFIRLTSAATYLPRLRLFLRIRRLGFRVPPAAHSIKARYQGKPGTGLCVCQDNLGILLTPLLTRGAHSPIAWAKMSAAEASAARITWA